MRVLSISHYFCVRAAKHYIALAQAQIPVHLLVSHEANRDLQSVAYSMALYRNQEELALQLKRLPPWLRPDIIHLHNEPDWPVTTAREIFPQTPIVHEVHDFDSVLFGEIPGIETAVMAAADAYIFPSQEYQDYAEKTHSQAMSDKPRRVIWPLCNQDLFPWLDAHQRPKVGGIVYQGGLRTSYGYQALAQGLLQRGVPFHVFGEAGQAEDEYLAAGAVVHKTLPYMKLMEALTRFDWGWVGPGISHQQWDWAVPNKLFEYLAAGLPVMVHKAAAAARVVRELGVGVEIEDLDQVPQVYEQHRKLRKVVLEKRGMAYESQLLGIISLYKELLNGQVDDKQ